MIYIGEQFTLNSSLMQEEKTRCPEPSLDTDQQSDRYNLHRLTRTSLAQPSPICHQHLIPMWWTLLWKLTRYWPGTDISTISSTFDSNVAGLAVPGQTDTPHHTTVDWLSHDPHYVITMWFQCSGVGCARLNRYTPPQLRPGDSKLQEKHFIEGEKRHLFSTSARDRNTGSEARRINKRSGTCEGESELQSVRVYCTPTLVFGCVQ